MFILALLENVPQQWYIQFIASQSHLTYVGFKSYMLILICIYIYILRTIINECYLGHSQMGNKGILGFRHGFKVKFYISF